MFHTFIKNRTSIVVLDVVAIAGFGGVEETTRDD